MYQEDTPVKFVKRLLVGVVIAFVLFYVITRPEEAANAVQAVWSWILGAVTAVGSFFVELANG